MLAGVGCSMVAVQERQKKTKNGMSFQVARAMAQVDAEAAREVVEKTSPSEREKKVSQLRSWCPR